MEKTIATNGVDDSSPLLEHYLPSLTRPVFQVDATEAIGRLRVQAASWSIAEGRSLYGSKIAGEQLPNIVEEFTDFPVGFSVEHKALCIEALQTAYIVYRTQPWVKIEMLEKNCHFVPGKPVYEASDVIRRWGGTVALKKQDAILSPEQGVISWKEDLSPTEMDKLCYSPDIRASFGNCPARRDALSWNTTHVAVGFNDLMIMLKAKFESSGVEPGKQRWFRFVGIDMNPYSVAKSEVIGAMLTDSSVLISHVIQVWFSSTWSRECLASFLLAVQGVLLSKSSHAKVNGLQSESGQKLNGRQAIVEKVLPNGRARVRVSGIETPLSLKLANMTPLGLGGALRATHKQEDEYEVGHTVRIRGLQNEAVRYLNGRSGKLHSYSRAKGRWAVDVGQDILKEIKPSNLVFVPDPQVAVLAYLEHWYFAASASESVILSVVDARAAWWEAQLADCPERYLYPIGSMKRKRDRVAVCRYLLTGDILGGPEDLPEIGSVVMWNVPGFAPKMEAGSALGVVAIEDLVAIASGHYMTEVSFECPHGTPSDADRRACESAPDILCLFTKLVETCIQSTVRSTACFEFEFLCDSVSHKNKVLLDRIAEVYRPYTMSWSNVLDYMKPTVFHEVARRCSPHGDCIHMGYSMNWSQEYWHANIMDWIDQESDRQTRADIINHAMDYCSKFPGEGNAEVEKFVNLALSVFLTSPLREDPENLTSFYLAASCAPKWVSDHFFKMATLRDRPAYLTENNSGCCEINSSCCFICNPLQRVCTSVSFLWTYDPHLTTEKV